MSRKTTRRKHWPLINPIDMAIEGACITSNGLLNKLRFRELSAIESFAKGQAVPNDLREVADMHNIAKTLVSMGIGGDEAKLACALADQALQAAHANQAQRGKLGMTGLQIQALRDLYQWHDAQRTAINRSRYEQAIERTKKRDSRWSSRCCADDMTSRQKVWSVTLKGLDGLTYSLRAMQDLEEMNGLKEAGAIIDFDEIIGMQEASDALMAGFEKQQHEFNGGTIQ